MKSCDVSIDDILIANFACYSLHSDSRVRDSKWDRRIHNHRSTRVVAFVLFIFFVRRSLLNHFFVVFGLFISRFHKNLIVIKAAASFCPTIEWSYLESVYQLLF